MTWKERRRKMSNVKEKLVKREGEREREGEGEREREREREKVKKSDRKIS